MPAVTTNAPDGPGQGRLTVPDMGECIMAIQLRHYTSSPGFSQDYSRVFEFLVRINQPDVVNEGFVWGRWEWMFSLSFLDRDHLDRIGIWEEDGRIVALATYEQTVGHVWFCLDPDYPFLRQTMLEYALDNLGLDGKIAVLISDRDRLFQDAAAKLGFYATKDQENTAMLPIDDAFQVNKSLVLLPEGFRITSMAETYDLKKYNRVLWRGFNHEGVPPEADDMLQGRELEQSGPHADMKLKIAVVAPNGDFVSYCGMWYLPGTDYALVEPVATDPDYRRLGLGRAAVLEGVSRCGQMGARMAFVGSSQQFYYSIGFRPYSTDTWWRRKTT